VGSRTRTSFTPHPLKLSAGVVARASEVDKLVVVYMGNVARVDPALRPIPSHKYHLATPAVPNRQPLISALWLMGLSTQTCIAWGDVTPRFSQCCGLTATFSALRALESVAVAAAFAAGALAVLAAVKRRSMVHTMLVKGAGLAAALGTVCNAGALIVYAASACNQPESWTFAGATLDTESAVGAAPFLCIICLGLNTGAAVPLLGWRTIRKVRVLL
jgi:hypothetical protein